VCHVRVGLLCVSRCSMLAVMLVTVFAPLPHLPSVPEPRGQVADDS
jgi:hypothetical protein